MNSELSAQKGPLTRASGDAESLTPAPLRLCVSASAGLVPEELSAGAQRRGDATRTTQRLFVARLSESSLDSCAARSITTGTVVRQSAVRGRQCFAFEMSHPDSKSHVWATPQELGCLSHAGGFRGCGAPPPPLQAPRRRPKKPTARSRGPLARRRSDPANPEPASSTFRNMLPIGNTHQIGRGFDLTAGICKSR